VVNVITRSGAALGGTVGDRSRAGRSAPGSCGRATGHRLPNGFDVALSGTYEHSDGVQKLFFPAFNSPRPTTASPKGSMPKGTKQFYGRASKGGLTITTMYGTRRRDIPTASSGRSSTSSSFTRRRPTATALRRRLRTVRSVRRA
jgi:iron complex outermembrane receptor protein